MASKYGHLKGKVPAPPTERDEAIEAALRPLQGKSMQALALLYNTQKAKAAILARHAKARKAVIDALEMVMLRNLESAGLDGIKAEGFTWSPSFEPFPVCEDPDAIVKYFEENGLEDQLKLTKTELAGRLKSFVKDESVNGELEFGTKEITDPDGSIREVPDVRSKIPGVRVFLQSALSRVKSSR